MIKLTKILKEIKVRGNKPPEGWTEYKWITEPGEEDWLGGKVISAYSAPMEGWDEEHPDEVKIIKLNDGRYKVEVNISYGDYPEIPPVNTFPEAKSLAFNHMEEITKDWPSEDEDEGWEIEEIKEISVSKDSSLNLQKGYKNMRPLLEYSQKIVDQLMNIYRTQTRVGDVQILHYINRFNDLKNVLKQKFENPETKPITEPLIPKDLQEKNKYLDITLWKNFDDLKKVVDGVSKKTEDVWKLAFDNLKKKNPNVDENAVRYYVERFKAQLKNIQKAVEDKNEEIVNLIPKELLKGDKYLIIGNWDLHSLETLIDTAFPRQQAKGGERTELNAADIEGDLIYNKDKLEIYQGDSEHKCIRYGKNEYYSWCISRKHGSMYTNYRLGHGGEGKLMFYFIFDRSKTDERSAGRFADPYHAVVIHALKDGKYMRTLADNNGDAPSGGCSWSKLGDYFEGKKGQDLWNKIKDLKNLFKYKDPSKDELKQNEYKNKSLTLAQFASLTAEDKMHWLRANATNNKIVTPEIVKTLDEKQKNDLINHGKTFSFDEIKSNVGLLKRYPDYRFTRHPDEPLPYRFIPYLKEDLQRKYYEKFEQDYLTFSEIEKYFSKNILKEYINKQINNVDFLPQEAIPYLDEKQRKFFEIYSITFKNVTVTGNTNIDEDTVAPSRAAELSPLSYDDLMGLPKEKRNLFLELVRKFGSKPIEAHESFFTGLRTIFLINGKLIFFLTKENIEGTPDFEAEFLLFDENGKIFSTDNLWTIEVYKGGKQIDQNGIGSLSGHSTAYLTESDFDYIILNKKDDSKQKITKDEFLKLNELFERNQWFADSLKYKAGII
jgi:hypothetical protein